MRKLEMKKCFTCGASTYNPPRMEKGNLYFCTQEHWVAYMEVKNEAENNGLVVAVQMGGEYAPRVCTG